MRRLQSSCYQTSIFFYPYLLPMAPQAQLSLARSSPLVPRQCQRGGERASSWRPGPQERGARASVPAAAAGLSARASSALRPQLQLLRLDAAALAAAGRRRVACRGRGVCRVEVSQASACARSSKMPRNVETANRSSGRYLDIPNSGLLFWRGGSRGPRHRRRRPARVRAQGGLVSQFARWEGVGEMVLLRQPCLLHPSPTSNTLSFPAPPSAASWTKQGLAEVARSLGQALRAFQPTVKELQASSRLLMQGSGREREVDSESGYRRARLPARSFRSRPARQHRPPTTPPLPYFPSAGGLLGVQAEPDAGAGPLELLARRPAEGRPRRGA